MPLLAAWVLIRASDWQLRPAEETAPDAPKAQPLAHKSYRSTLSRGIVWVNIALFFFYTGTEVSAGNWAYTLFTEGRGVPVAVAGFWASFYWASFTFGRFVFGIIADRINVVNAVRTMMLLAILGTALLWWNPVDWVSFAGPGAAWLCPCPRIPAPDLVDPDTSGRRRRDQRHRFPGGRRFVWHCDSAGPGGRAGRTIYHRDRPAVSCW